MSQNPNELRLGPYAECGRTTSNIGYRDVLTGQVAASVEIPSELIERAVLANVSVEIALSTKEILLRLPVAEPLFALLQ